MTGPQELLAAQRNIHSQYGEDGIIAAILDRLPAPTGWCVEFGAWDGRHLSNTRSLIDDRGYSAVMIEANPTVFAGLQREFASTTRVHCLNAFVGFGDGDSLDVLLSGTPCPRDFDVLSIDIDGNDIHVWKAVSTWRPRLVIIEFNPTIPTVVDFAQPPRPELKWGASLRAMFDVGSSKGYRLVCANHLNAFFVAQELWSGDYARSADDLPRFREQEPTPVYLFSGYDGTVLLSGEATLGWHQIPVNSKDVQVLPEVLRRYPDDYSWFQRRAFGLFKRVRG